MGFIAEAKRKNLWFGTEEKMEWFKTPSRGADTSPAGWDSEGTTLNGGGYVFNSFGSHKQYQFDWGSSNARVVAQKMKSYADGSYGRGYIYFVDPTIYDHNVLPAHWADPSMGIDYEGNSIVAGVEPVGVPTGANSNDLPVQAAQFNLNTIPVGFRGRAQAVYVPIPEGHTLSLGAMYSFTGSGGVFASPVLLTGAIAAPQKLTTLGVNTPNIVADTFSGVRGVWLWVGKTSAGNSSVTIHGLIGRLMTDAEATSYTIAENLFTNPNLVGDGTFAEVGRNLFMNPRLVGDGTFAIVRRNRCPRPIADATWYSIITGTGAGAISYTVLAGQGVEGSPVFESTVTTAIDAGRVIRILGSSVPADRRFAVTVGESITASADVSIGGGTQASNTRLMLMFYNSAGAYVSETSSPVLSTVSSDPANPTRMSNTSVVPATAAFAEAVVQTTGGTIPVGSKMRAARILIGTGNYFDGSTMDNSMVQPEDFRVRWLGTENASESVMEIERVGGLTATNCVAGASSRDGKPAVRLIPTANNSDSFAQLIIPSGAARLGGTALGTSSSDAPLTSPVNPNGYALGIRTITPNRYTGRSNDAVPRKIRHIYDALSSDYGLRWYHGGALGSGDVWWTDIALFAGDYRYPWNGSPDLTGITQPEDFRTRWSGAVDNSELVLEIERVRGLTAANCVAGVSTRDGKPAVRVIPTGISNESRFYFEIPVSARSGGTLLGTISQDGPLTGTLWTVSRTLRTVLPASATGQAPNIAGSTALRLSYAPVSSTYWATFNHGGSQGSGDVWWTDIGLFVGSYDGPAFSGSSPQNGTTHYRWTGAVDNSTSEAYYVSAKATQQKRGPWVGGMGHSGCRFVGKPTFIENGPDWTGFSATFKEVVN